MQRANRDFSGTTITSAIEIMRANAVISSNLDKAGLNMIGFNLPLFTTPQRQEDGIFVLCEWAVEPMRKSPEKFVRYPETGQNVLMQRVQGLIDHLAKRNDIFECFLNRAQENMDACIRENMNALINDHDRKRA